MPDIIVTEHDGWAHFQINRASKRNALNQAMRLDLIKAFRSYTGRVRAVVLTGSEAWFCCGADLKERAKFVEAGKVDPTGPEGIQLALAIREFPGVVIAAINGLALGYGVNLINCADVAIASDQATMGLPELRQGAFASMSAATSLLSGLNRKRVGWMVYNSDPIDAQTALSWGLVTEVLPNGRLHERAAELAGKIAGFHPDAVADTKSALETIPNFGTQWGDAMEFGQAVGTRIKTKVNGNH